MFKRLQSIGPGALVAAAFIGPGTVTACTVAGATFGYALLWSLVFATAATIILQEMSARLGIVAQRGLAETLREIFAGTIWKWPLFALVSVALYVGNAAYEAGNLSGAALGLSALAGETAGLFRMFVGAIAVAAGLILLMGSYRQIEKALIGLVLIMSAAFVATFIITRPDLAALARGLVTPALPEGSLMTVIALIGTTVVPYNLFLHASAVKSRWRSAEHLRDARTDTIVSVGAGGLITLLIASTAAAGLFAAGVRVETASDMARQFEPLFGPFSRYLLGIGLFAAGLSSAITAPLATAFAMSEILGVKGGEKSPVFRAVMLSVVVIGAALALTGVKPVRIILSAQFANGLLLPIIATFLLFAMNNRRLLGGHANGALTNGLGIAVVLITFGLGARSVMKALGFG